MHSNILTTNPLNCKDLEIFCETATIRSRAYFQLTCLVVRARTWLAPVAS